MVLVVKNLRNWISGIGLQSTSDACKTWQKISKNTSLSYTASQLLCYHLGAYCWQPGGHRLEEGSKKNIFCCSLAHSYGVGWYFNQPASRQIASYLPTSRVISSFLRVHMCRSCCGICTRQPLSLPYNNQGEEAKRGHTHTPSRKKGLLCI